ncbi:MAG: AAA family ATPase [Erythrobacter sp.]|nr:AAA family ATPase [Erythrobacter sp.]PCJ44985.1 MAG: ATP-dependent endonuclease [Candidatus Neomarinimicrobiota bacterium]
MKLIKARVQNFRSVEDSGEFEVNNMTCLVGKNEAGKTAILQALQGLRPYGTAQTEFNVTKEYPRRFVTRFEQRHDEEPAEAVRTWWQLEDNELNLLREKFGDEAVTGSELQVVKNFKATGTVWTPPVSHQKAVFHLMDKAGMTQEERANYKGTYWSPTLMKELEEIAERSAKEEDLLKRLKGFRDGNVVKGAIDILDPYTSKFFYVSHYDRMSGRISVDKLLEDQQNDRVSIEDQIFLDFLHLAGTSLEELRDAKEYEDLKAKCEAASNDITEQIFKYWTQNDSLEVNVDFAHAKPDDPAPFNSGTVVHARVWNTLHRASVPFSERSAGFVWFFSFLVQFAAMRDEEDDVVILLDEPGLTLHGKAQADLLRYMAEELLPHHQVIFSTHSPFMVPADNFESVRIVEDVVDRTKSRPEVLGTKVRSDALATDKDTLFPLQGALGYDIAQSLFVGRNTLLVEGPSDILYLQALSEALKRRKREGLASDWVICPTGGVDKVRSFVSLFGGNQLNVAVLTDFAKGDRNKIEQLKRSEILKADKIQTYADFTGKDESDVEDVFSAKLFAEIVNNAYALPAGKKLTPKKMSDAVDSVIRQVKQTEALFRTMPDSIPEFDHFTPSSWLVFNPDILDGDQKEVEDTLDVAESIFKSINSFL